MFNYIKAELYRNLNRPYIWTYSLIFAGLTLALNIILKLARVPNMDLGSVFALLNQLMILPIYLVAASIEISTSEEQKNLTLKNTVTFGIPRSIIALSKVIVAIIISFIVAIIIYTVYLGSGAILFGINPGNSTVIADTCIRILAALPAWIGAISVGTLLALMINNPTSAAFSYAGVFVGVSPIVDLLRTFVSHKFDIVKEVLLTTQLKSLSAEVVTSDVLIKAVLIGIIYTVLFTGLSMVYIKKKEIK